MFFYQKRLKKSTPEDDEKFMEAMKENEVGFKDGFAMIAAAFFTIVLPCAAILTGICFLGLLVFGVL